MKILLMSFQRIIILVLMMGIAAQIYGKSSEPSDWVCGNNLNEKALEIEKSAMEIWGKVIMGKDVSKIHLAANAFKQAIELEPRLVSAYVNLSLYYQIIQKPEEAIPLIKKGIDSCPKTPVLYLCMGTIYSKMGSYDDTLKYYNKALSLGMQDDSIYYNLGNTYAKIGQYDKAITFLKKSLEINPKKLQACVALLISYFRKGEIERAVETARKVLELDPNGEDGRNAKEFIKKFENKK